jgi:hypothetical protein
MSRRVIYADYLLSDHWKFTRELALDRAGRRCQCGLCPFATFYRHELADRFPRAWTRLEVHHLSYERLGHEAPDDLLVLCGHCHAAAHGLPLPQDAPGGPVPVPLREVMAGLPIFGRPGFEEFRQ